jgi:hypothetical protein
VSASEPFSVEEIQFIVSQRIRSAMAAGALTTRREDIARIAESIREGLGCTRRHGYVAQIVVAVRARISRRTGTAELDVWSGPSGDPRRPEWAHYGQEGVHVVQA